MKVVQLGPYPPPHGGVQTNLVAIREYLRRNGHACDAVNLTRFRHEDADGVYYPETASQLMRLLWRLPADILHLHFGGDLTPRLLGLALFCTMIPGRKTVMSFHSGGYPGSPAGRTAAPGTLRGFVLRRLDGAIAVNSEIALLFRKFGVRAQRIRTILPFVVQPPDRGLPLPDRLASFLAKHRPALLTVGLLEPEYDLPMQIDAMEGILERFPGAGLLIVGAGSLEESLRRHIESKPYRDRVLLYGDMPHAVTVRAMLECDILLRTTRYDGDSVSVREALYFGTPVIATDNGMRPAGVHLIPVSDAAQLRDAVARLLDPQPPIGAATVRERPDPPPIGAATVRERPDPPPIGAATVGERPDPPPIGAATVTERPDPPPVGAATVRERPHPGDGQENVRAVVQFYEELLGGSTRSG